jgi:hypothetical protein
MRCCKKKEDCGERVVRVLGMKLETRLVLRDVYPLRGATSFGSYFIRLELQRRR